jgi:hypothetical protein
MPIRRSLSRDNLDENGSGDRNVKRAAGGDIMIVSDFAVRKRGFCVTRGAWRADTRATCGRD